MGDISLGKVLGQCAGKTIRGVIETPDDIQKGVLTIQFTDDTTIHVYAYDPRGDDLMDGVHPKLSGVVALTEHGLPERRPDPDAFAEKVPTRAFDDEWVESSTEAGNPIQDSDLPPGAETAEYREPDDDKPFHPVDVVDFDELG